VLLCSRRPVPTPSSDSPSGCKRLEWEKRLTVFFRPLEGEPVSYATRAHARRYALQAIGVDRAGIVAKIARCLADHASRSPP
jgi:glycine cleavage system regulatory protein